MKRSKPPRSHALRGNAPPWTLCVPVILLVGDLKPGRRASRAVRSHAERGNEVVCFVS